MGRRRGHRHAGAPPRAPTRGPRPDNSRPIAFGPLPAAPPPSPEAPVLSPPPKQLRGIPLAQRHLLSLAAGIERAAGRDAVRRTKLVVAVDPDSEARLLSDLSSRKFYGFDPENVLVVVALRSAGFRADPSAGRLARDDASPALPLGPGLDLVQLSWGNEAFGAE